MAKVDDIRNEARKKKLAQESLYQSNMAMLMPASVGVPPKPVKKEAAKGVPPKKVATQKAPAKEVQIHPTSILQTDIDDERFVEEEEGVPPIPVEPEAVPEAIPEREPASKSYDLGGWEDVAAVGAGPLLAFLGGASPAVFNMHMDKANASAKAIGEEARITKDKITVLEDENGDPVNALIKESLGKKPYYQKKLAGGAGGNAREFAPIGVKNIKSGEVLPAKVTGNGFVNIDTGELFDSNWLPFRKDDLIREKTYEGGSKVTARESYTGKLKRVTSQRGIGNDMGGISKEQSMSAIKQAEQSKAAVARTNEALENAQFAYDMLGDTKITAQKAASAMTILAKAINKDKVSDADFTHLKGEDLKSYLTQLDEWAKVKVGGARPEEALRAFREIAKEIIAMKRGEIESLRSIYNPKGAVPAQGQKIIDGITGGNTPAQTGPSLRDKMKGWK